MSKQKSNGRQAFNSRVGRYTTLVLGAATTAVVFAGVAQAQTQTKKSSNDQDMTTLSFPQKFMKQVVKGSQVHGRVGVYDFRRWHDTNQPFPGQNPRKNNPNYDVHNDNYGAQIGITSGRIFGFSGGAQFVYESSFYGNNASDTALNCNLAGSGCGGNGSSVTDLTEGYLQFNAYGTQIRAGRQLLNTPLAGADQFTFLPRSFDGVSVVMKPLQTMSRLRYRSEMASSQGSASSRAQITQEATPDNQNYTTDQYLPFPGLNASTMSRPDWQLFGAAIHKYEGRGNSSKFVHGNRYFKNGGGFWAAGTSVTDVTPKGQFIGQYYHYNFYNTEDADYVEGGYMMPTIGSGDTAFAPYIRAQYLKAYNGDKSRIPQGIDADLYGVKLGVQMKEVGFSVFGDYSPTHNGSFNHGQYLHPYTDLSGVLYTDTMNDGLQEIGPGWAAGARVDFTPTDNFSMYARYVHYVARHGHYHDFLYSGPYNQISDASFFGQEVNNQKSNGIGVGFTYDLGGVWHQLAGLKIGDNLGVTKFNGAPTFYDNRVRFYYSF